jgi:hypothetical protein
MTARNTALTMACHDDPASFLPPEHAPYCLGWTHTGEPCSCWCHPTPVAERAAPELRRRRQR